MWLSVQASSFRFMVKLCTAEVAWLRTKVESLRRIMERLRNVVHSFEILMARYIGGIFVAR